MPRKETVITESGGILCRSCQIEQALENFYRNSVTKIGYEAICKGCSREKAKTWRNENKQNRSKSPRAAEKSANRRAARMTILNSGQMANGWRKALFDFYGNVCLKCGKSSNLHADHVHALSRGGLHSPDNLQVLCQTCNLSKHDKTADYRAGKFFNW